MRHNSAVSGHPISMSFSQVDDWLIDPRVLGRHNGTPNQKWIAIEPQLKR